MVVYEHDNLGFIVGFLEFEIVNDSGQFEDYGKYIYIQGGWIHPTLRKTKVIRKLIRRIDSHEYCRNAQWVYWRSDRHDRLSKPFLRKRLAKLGV